MCFLDGENPLEALPAEDLGEPNTANHVAPQRYDVVVLEGGNKLRVMGSRRFL
ncbi:hypothetical protein ACFWUU_38280 [Kribbella sp. NPDC058693]|uniref:hypothetical protein n=1 Tax=Kribbella sp. NPDC058693 TaxID=3346602 RepID=UPI003649E30F